MSKSLAFVGALAASLILASAGTAAAQSGDLLDSGSVSGSSDVEGDYLGSAGELLPGSVTGSLPGYASGPLGSVATLACNVGTVAGAAAGLTGVPLPIPVGVVCMVVNPVAESGDSLLNGDVDGSVSAIVGGVPLVGDSLEGQVDTASATEAVGGSLGDELGSLEETSLSPQN
ncbi:hypothetical protein [Dietzia sp. PP-33]|jgi:hypothetical protein|uniref:hypothetical protein n=1 Tax=Dietzia sp. PP-33 TaxID=2957500 RepID=UPI0029B16E73|nr:hypothetical protein [Dietzia sp. PP-33]MDX2357327.1 hypothetical protein [Dietzia sp. PP-33]